MTELTIKDILAILKKRLVWLIILPIVVGLAAGTYYKLFAQNEYTAEAKLYVLIDYTDATGQLRYDTGAGASFAGDYQELMQTDEVLSQVAQRMGYATIDDLNKALTIKVSSVTNTRVLTVAVTSGNPVTSRDAANALTDVFVTYMQGLTKIDSVDVASKATLPLDPSGPARTRNTALAFVVTLLLVAGIVLAVEMLNTTIRTDKDIEIALGLPVLARIGGYRKEMQAYLRTRAKNRKTLLESVSLETREDIKTLAMNLKFASSATEEGVQAIALTSTAPSEGKSSVAIMLASELAEEGHMVLLIDMDFRNPSLGMYMGARSPRDIVDYINRKADFDDIAFMTPVRNVAMIDSCHKDAITTKVIQSVGFARLLEEARRRYRYVILDTPPLGMFVDAAMITKGVDGVLLVVGSGAVERDHAKEVVDQLRKADADILGVVLNFVNRKNSASHYYYRRSRYYRQYNSNSRSAAKG